MRVEANVTSGLLTTDSSAVELVPLLQAEVKKLREMLAQQRILPLERGIGELGERDREEMREFNESKVVEEMRERVRELEQQLAEREKLIDSLDMQRKEQLLEDEEEAERMFLMSEDGKGSGGHRRGSVNNRDNRRYDRNEGEERNERDDDSISYNDDINDNNNNYYYNAKNDNSSNKKKNNNGINGNDNSNNDDNNNNKNNDNTKNNNIDTNNSDKFNLKDSITWETENREVETKENKGKKNGNKPLVPNSSFSPPRKNPNFNPQNTPVNKQKQINSMDLNEGSVSDNNKKFNSSMSSSSNNKNNSNSNNDSNNRSNNSSITNKTNHGDMRKSLSLSSSSSTDYHSTGRNQPVVVLSEDAVDESLPRVINLNQVGKKRNSKDVSINR